MADEAVKTQLELIADALNKINDTKNDIANAVSGHVDKDNKQIEIPETAPLFEYADYISKIKVGNNIETDSLYATENGTYNAESGMVYNPIDVEVDVEVGSTTITENGTYDAASEGLVGWDSISIDVDEYSDEDDENRTPTDKDDKDLILGQLTATHNRVYKASSDVVEEGNDNTYSLDGFDEVTVEVPEEEQKESSDAEFTVKFMDGTKELYSTMVGYGQDAEYAGTTPSREGLYFVGWKPEPVNVTNDMEVKAEFSKTKPETKDGEIRDSWTTIISKGSASYKPGSYKYLNVGKYGRIRMQKVNNGNAWVAMDPLDVRLAFSKYKSTTYTQNQDGSHTPNPTIENGGKPYDIPMNPNGWRTSGLRAILNSDVYNEMQQAVRGAIFPTTKYTRAIEYTNTDGNGNTQFIFINERTQDLIWIPSYKEIFGDSKDFPENGTHFTFFNSSEERKMAKNNQYIRYPLRSAHSSINNTGCVDSSGKFSNLAVGSEEYIRIGFSLK